MTALVMASAAVLCAAASVALLFPGLTSAASLGRHDPMRTVPPTGAWPRRAVLLVVVAAVALLTIAEGSVLALGLILVAAAAGTLRLLAGGRRRTLAEAREGRVLEVCEVLVGELRSGQPPVTAIEHCVEVWPDFEPVASAARLGADVPTALRRLARTPGAAGLREVAGAWTVSAGAGAGLSVALGQVATSAREAQGTRRLITSELASAQATARLVAVLPVVTLVMGSGVGGDPWGFLLRTPPGLCCLAVGLVLAFAGLTWIDRIAVAVLRL